VTQRKTFPFAELGEEKASFVPLPDLPEIEGLTADEAVADRIREGALQVREWTAAVLPKIDAAKAGSREAREQAADAIAEAESTLQSYLEHDTRAWRRASLMAVFSHHLAKELRSRPEAEALLQDLVDQGYLEDITPEKKEQEESPQELPAEALRAYDKAYIVPADFAFGDPEIGELRQLLASFLRRVWAEERQIRTLAAKDLFSQSNLSPEEFRAGKPGKLTLGIPPEEVRKSDGTTAFWRGGGTLQVESNGERVTPLAATGTIQGAIEEAVSLKVHLLLRSLEWDTTPYVQALPPEMNKKIQLLWHLLQRGLLAAEEKRQRQDLRDEFEKRATITPEQFFLEGQPGICLVQLEEDWEDRDQDKRVINRVLDPFFLAERFNQGDEQGFIRILEVPPHFEEMLASCMGEHPEGEKFLGLPYPLVLILQNAYGQTQKAAQINNK